MNRNLDVGRTVRAGELLFTISPDTYCTAQSTVTQALQAGVVGFLTFEEAQDRLVGAVRSILSGNVYFGQELFHSLLDELLPDALSGLEALLGTLSDRELEVFQAVGEGILVREVGERLNIHVKTVDTYLRRIRKKLGTETTQQLSAIAKRWMYPKNHAGYGISKWRTREDSNLRPPGP